MSNITVLTIPFHSATTLTVCSINKCSLLKLLCTLARLCEGIPLQPPQLDFFGINFSFRPCSQFTFFSFCGQGNRTRGKSCRSREHAPLPDLPAPVTPLPNLPLITCQGKNHVHVTPFSFATGRWINIYLANNELTLFFLCYFHYRRGRGEGGREEEICGR